MAEIIKDVGGRIARDERIFTSPIVLEDMPNYYGYLYVSEK